MYDVSQGIKGIAKSDEEQSCPLTSRMSFSLLIALACKPNSGHKSRTRLFRVAHSDRFETTLRRHPASSTKDMAGAETGSIPRFSIERHICLSMGDARSSLAGSR